MLGIFCFMELALIVFIVFNLGYRKELFKNLKKEDKSLKPLFGPSARILDLAGKKFKSNGSTKVSRALKQICVKENIQDENYRYQAKKISLILLLSLICCGMGILVSIGAKEVREVKELKRNEAGGGDTTYGMEVSAENGNEEIEIEIEERKKTSEEILQLFDESIDEIKNELKGENESLDKVCKPLNFLYSYNGISIYWEIEDTDLIGYDGQIKEELNPGESLFLNLFATLSYDETKSTYTIGVNVVANEKTTKEKLVDEIYAYIETQNDVHDLQVNLPEEIDGKKIKFSFQKEDKGPIILILMIVGIIGIVIGYDKNLEKKLKERRSELLIDFTEIVSKLSLLYDAGLSVKGAFEKIVADYEKKKIQRYAYQEMKLALEKIKNGMSERDAYVEFGKRCGLHQYIKLGNILDQNLSKGTKGMKKLLQEEVEEAFEERKRMARKKGEEASTKMLFPMILMLLVVVVIVALPALMSMNMQ